MFDSESNDHVIEAVHSAYRKLTVNVGTAERRPYHLSVTIEGEGDVEIDPLNTMYAHGGQVTLTASSQEEGWFLEEWRGDYTGTDDEITIEMLDDTEITAVSVNEGYTFEVVTSGQGRVILQPESERYANGEEVNLLAQPESGWLFTEW